MGEEEINVGIKRDGGVYGDINGEATIIILPTRENGPFISILHADGKE